MTHPFDLTVLPVHLAKRMVENRGGVATEDRGCLEIRRNGELLHRVPIVEDGVPFLAVCGALAAR